jgi:glucan phosphorylase
MVTVARTNFMSRLSHFNARHANSPRVVYASMEYGIKPGMPIFGGGLGILSGDTVKSAADLGIPMVAVGLRYYQGNFKQSFEGDWQQAGPQEWNPERTDDLYDLETMIEVP